MTDSYVTAAEAARILCVSKPKVSELIKRGDLPAIVPPLNRRLKLIKREDVERLMRDSHLSRAS